MRVERIELSSSAWKADILPLNYTRGMLLSYTNRLKQKAKIPPLGGIFDISEFTYSEDSSVEVSFGASSVEVSFGASSPVPSAGVVLSSIMRFILIPAEK